MCVNLCRTVWTTSTGLHPHQWSMSEDLAKLWWRLTWWRRFKSLAIFGTSYVHFQQQLAHSLFGESSEIENI